MSDKVHVFYCWVLLMISVVVFIHGFGYFYTRCYSLELSGTYRIQKAGLQQGRGRDKEDGDSAIADAEKQPKIARPIKGDPKSIDRLVQKAEPTIFAITSTYARLVQKAELTRLSQTLLHVTNFHWILVEDSENKTTLVTNLLKRSGLNYTHLNIATPAKYKNVNGILLCCKGTMQKNIGLDWLVATSKADDLGVVYFADDDNTYSLRLFEEMRYTNKVSVWPVGLAGVMRYEAPILNDHGQVIGWKAWASKERKFAIDMAGFAVNLRLFHEKPDARFNITGRVGFDETSFLEKLVTMEELEPKADGCTKVYVWHTMTVQSNRPADLHDSYVEV